MPKVNPVPEGYATVTPMLCVEGAASLIDFLQQAFDAEPRERHERPDGAIMHAEVRIGDSIVMLSDASPPMPPMPAALYLYVEDVDAVYQQALAAGGQSNMPPADMFWGDRSASIQDPAGNAWWISTHVEDVSSEELARRAAAFEQDCGPS